ncbi:hypothetical protein TNCV_728551 [Trichonephila clavipes]|nr:hypothetical protein TNCV_728551 [Trichonephila clavipes]
MRQANQQFSSTLTKIGNGEQLDEMEITMIESRFCTVEEAEARCPQELSSPPPQFEKRCFNEVMWAQISKEKERKKTRLKLK